MSLFSWILPAKKKPAKPALPESSGLSRMEPTRPVRRGSSDVPADNGQPANRKHERMARREMLYGIVRESMVRAGVLSSSYKFKVLSLDPRGALEVALGERQAGGAGAYPLGITEQRGIREINAGVYVGDAAALRRTLAKIGADNDQGEQYVTDVLGLLVQEGAPVGGHVAEDPDDVLGCNDRRELAARRRTLNDRVLDDLMRSGVTVIDPQTTWVDVTCTVAADAVLEPGTQLHGTTTVAPGGGVSMSGWTVKNQGTASTVTGFNNGFYLSTGQPSIGTPTSRPCSAASSVAPGRTVRVSTRRGQRALCASCREVLPWIRRPTGP